MAQQEEKIFASGMYFQKRDSAPTYIVGSLSMKVPELIPFLNKHQNNAGYVNVEIIESKKGGYYIQLNTWKPTNSTAKEEVKKESNTIEYPDEQINPEDIPF